MEQKSIFLRRSTASFWNTKAHLDRFLCDVLVHLGGGVLVQPVQEDLREERRGQASGVKAEFFCQNRLNF